MYQADLWHSHYWIDLRDWASTIATAAAAWLAYIAIRQTQRQAKVSADALLEERHVTYTLEVLRDLGDAVMLNWNFKERGAGARVRVQTLLHLCPERMPMTRCAFDAFPTQDERAAYDAVTAEKLGSLSVIQQEIVVALDEIAETARRLLGQPSPEGDWSTQKLLDDVAAAAWQPPRVKR
jgi:hypothetical protein